MQSPGGWLYIEEKVVTPDALCFADRPACGASGLLGKLTTDH
jgi:hypothetical protein